MALRVIIFYRHRSSRWIFVFGRSRVPILARKTGYPGVRHGFSQSCVENFWGSTLHGPRPLHVTSFPILPLDAKNRKSKGKVVPVLN